MLMLMNDRAIARVMAFGVTAAIAIAVAAPSMAATVWSWTTEEGTAAFTNEVKRIPAKYKDSAKRRTIGALKNYPRLTKSDVKYKKPYAERVTARLERLRGGPPAVSAGPAMAGKHPITVDIGMGAGAGRAQDQISIPVEAEAGDEPIVVQDYSVRLRDSIATRRVNITRQGDKVLAIRVGSRNPRKINERLDEVEAEALGGRYRSAIGPN